MTEHKKGCVNHIQRVRKSLGKPINSMLDDFLCRHYVANTPAKQIGFFYYKKYKKYH